MKDGGPTAGRVAKPGHKARGKEAAGGGGKETARKYMERGKFHVLDIDNTTPKQFPSRTSGVGWGGGKYI